MIDKVQLKDLIRWSIADIGLYSAQATELLLLTAAVESRLGTYIRQIKGPALGIYQMEPSTHDDIWDNFLAYKPKLAARIARQDASTMVYDLKYATQMARIHYYRVKEALPPADDIEAMAKYHKKYYNTSEGKSTLAKTLEAYEDCCS